MRRAIPWVLMVLLVIGAGLGAVLGAAGAPGVSPSAWTANVLARTAAAGSARFTFAGVTTSPNPDERGADLASGEIDFTTGDARVAEVEHQVTFGGTSQSMEHAESTTTSEEDIEIGATQYQDVLPNGLGPSWMKMPGRPNGRDSLGLSNAGGAATVLEAITPPATIANVQNVGTTTIDGQPATRYVVKDVPVQTCSGASKAILGWISLGPTTIWVDARGRLVQARLVMHDSGHIPAQFLAKIPQLEQFPMQPSTTTMTLRFSDFGVPVHIEAPPPSAISTPQSQVQIKGKAVSEKCGR